MRVQYLAIVTDRIISHIIIMSTNQYLFIITFYYLSNNIYVTNVYTLSCLSINIHKIYKDVLITLSFDQIADGYTSFILSRLEKSIGNIKFCRFTTSINVKYCTFT